MDGTQCNKGHMRKLLVISVCLFASMVDAAFIPTMITGIDTARVVPDERPVIEYHYTESLPEKLIELEDVQERKQCLIDTLLPLVLKSNETILQQRAFILGIKQRMPLITVRERRTLESLAEMYMVETGTDEHMIEELLMRVDILPVSLILAQAAIESGWGTSRFCLEGNNVFGLRTLSEYGMDPKERDHEKAFRVSVFNDLQSCIDYYIWTINTNAKYEELRRIRSMSLRPYDSLTLARGLRYYSEMGSEYVKKVEALISYNDLKAFDDYRLQ
jgi:Bax protein